MKKILLFLLILTFSLITIGCKLDAGKIYSTTVNNKTMKAFVKGSGSQTIVLLSGWGTESPIDDFKGLADNLSSDYKVVIIEYFGYGTSDITTDERSNKIIVEEIRICLKELQINPPYILIPHSMSGLYSLYYANNYPQEVNAIISIDASLPQKQLERWNKQTFENVKLDVDISGLNVSMVNQWNKFFDNSDELKDLKYPENLPVLSFLATEQIDGVNEMISNGEMKTSWIKINESMITNTNFQFIRVLEGSHYLHHNQSDKISKISKNFIKETL